MLGAFNPTNLALLHDNGPCFDICKNVCYKVRDTCFTELKYALRRWDIGGHILARDIHFASCVAQSRCRTRLTPLLLNEASCFMHSGQTVKLAGGSDQLRGSSFYDQLLPLHHIIMLYFGWI
ncbi:hypothetical protein RRG08_013196 [Elysia crispata]|uniref:Uncharacterized protein n=1 Tax=Elysia crispata TaxID=231223 RepID=A0AAE1B5S9_9GAST|nr:hypothetical protein RRG08_013196 [Elysia crispata]